MMQPSYDAILFDFDGVLAETEPLHCEAWRRALEPLGITFDWEFYRTHFIGISDSEVLAILASRAVPRRPVEELWRQFQLKQRLFKEMALADPPVPEEIRRMLKSLHRYKIGLVSSTSRFEIEPLLAAANIADLFDAVVCAEDVTKLKPDPEPYLKAARRLDATRPLVIEDSEAGIAAARAAGFEVIRVATPWEVPARLSATLGGLLMN